MDRAHRLGQDRAVHVYRLITRSSIEESLLGLQVFKMLVADTVVDPANSDLRAMQTERILDSLAAKGSGGAVPEDNPNRRHTLAEITAKLDEMWGTDQYAEFNASRFAQLLS